MNRIFFPLLVLVCPAVVLQAQIVDTTHAKKDSILFIIPIPETGSIEPFGDTSKILTAREITFREYRSLYDIIGAEPEVFMRDLASVGQRNQFSIGGIDDRNIAILVDGVPYNDHYTGTMNLWQVPVDEIERIEFRTGAGALFYDGKSGGGAINIVTKNFNNTRAMTRLRYSQGVSGYTHTDAMFAQNVLSGVNLSFALAHYGFGSDKGSQDYRARFYNSNSDSWLVRSKVRYTITQWLNLSFSYTYDRTWTGLHGGVDYFNTPSVFDGIYADVKNLESYEKQYNSHYNFTASYFPFEDSTLLATMSVYSFDRLREYRDEENRNIFGNGIFTKRDFTSSGKGAKFQFLSNLSELRLLGYADLKRVQSNDIVTLGVKAELLPESFFTVTPFATIMDDQSQFIANGGVEGTMRVHSSFQLFGAVSQNLIHDTPSTPVITASVLNIAVRSRETYSIIELGTQFSFPDLFHGRISYKRTIQRNPTVLDTMSLSSSFFPYDYFYPSQYAFNALTATGHLQWNDFHLEGSGNYVQQPSIKRLGTKKVTLFPEIILKGSVYYHGLLANRHLDLKIGLRGNYYSEQTGMKPYDEFGVWIPSTELSFGPGASLDFFAIGKIGDAYVHLIWENMTANQYLLAPVYPMYDRNIRFGLSWEFVD